MFCFSPSKRKRLGDYNLPFMQCICPNTFSRGFLCHNQEKSSNQWARGIYNLHDKGEYDAQMLDQQQ